MRDFSVLAFSIVLLAQVSFAQPSKLVQCTGKDITGNELSLSMSINEKELANSKIGFDATINVVGKMGGNIISIKNTIVKDKIKTNYFNLVGYALSINPTKTTTLTLAAFNKDASANLSVQDSVEYVLKINCSGI